MRFSLVAALLVVGYFIWQPAIDQMIAEEMAGAGGQEIYQPKPGDYDFSRMAEQPLTSEQVFQGHWPYARSLCSNVAYVQAVGLSADSCLAHIEQRAPQCQQALLPTLPEQIDNYEEYRRVGKVYLACLMSVQAISQG